PLIVPGKKLAGAVRSGDFLLYEGRAPASADRLASGLFSFPLPGVTPRQSVARPHPRRGGIFLEGARDVVYLACPRFPTKGPARPFAAAPAPGAPRDHRSAPAPRRASPAAGSLRSARPGHRLPRGRCTPGGSGRPRGGPAAPGGAAHPVGA